MTDDLTPQELEELKKICNAAGWTPGHMTIMVTDVPRLIAMVERLQEERDGWKRLADNSRDASIKSDIELADLRRQLAERDAEIEVLRRDIKYVQDIAQQRAGTIADQEIKMANAVHILRGSYPNGVMP